MAARDLGIPVDERPFSPAELMRADEVIVSSSSKLCKRVGSINGVSVGGRDIQNYDKIRNILLQQYDKLYN
jgi:D-alanine transaminase